MHPAHPVDKAPPDHEAVRAFVRTPLSVRRNIVKVWRALPRGLWRALDTAEDRRLATNAERRAVAGVLLMALLLAAGFGSLAYRPPAGPADTLFPLIGRPLPDPTAGAGWSLRPGISGRLVAWTVLPSLAGWIFVRSLWIPRAVRGHAHAHAALAFARHLSGVYLYVYVMILVGAALMPLMILAAPVATRSLRWALWCFLFGESFFVPAAMWLRLVLNDRQGEAFGRSRHWLLGLYLLACVIVPLLGMVRELGRLP